MSDIQYWHYLDAAGQQQGPITADQLQQFGASGQINAQTSVWTEGMEEWVLASQIEGLIPVIPVQEAAPVHQPQINLGVGQPAQAAAVNPYAAPAAAGPQAGGDYPIPSVNKVSVGGYIACLLGGIASLIIGSLVSSNESAVGASIALLLVGAILLLVSSILQLTTIYKAWKLLQPGGGSISPGAAVGLLFIPLFGSIWIFIVLFKLPGEWNNIVARYTNTQSAPRLGIATAVCSIFIPVIGLIMWISEVGKAINFMTSARLMPSNNIYNQSSGGGIVLR